MGEIADMMLDGTLCEGCGEYLHGEPGGYPRRCASCGSAEAPIYAEPRAIPKIPCPTCGKRVKVTGLSSHWNDLHRGIKPAPPGEGEG